MYPGTHAATNPDKLAIVMADTGETRSYAELEQRSARLARFCHEAGLRRGDHIAFIAPNSPEVFEIYWAALRSGLLVTGVNHHLSAEEAAYIVADCGARVLITSAEFTEIAAYLTDSPSDVEVRLAVGGDLDGYQDYEAALASVSAQPLAVQPRGADMLYSSGTTGRPKGIKPALPDREVHEPGDPFATVFGGMYGFDADTVYYSPAPTYHAAPLRFGGIVHMFNGTVVMTRKFDAEGTLAAIEKYGVTHAQFVPTMFVRMLKLPESVRTGYRHETLSTVIHAAAPCPVEVKQQMMAWWGPVLHEYYSSTEANGITLINPQQWLEKPGSVGKAGLGVIRICDEESGAEMPTGEVGTVYFERDIPPFEYHRAPEKSREARHPQHENWTTTGDLGYVDADGYLFLTDRKAFMIISGGVNIYPREVEDVLTLHPKVTDVAVIGIPDDEMGEQVKAVVQPAPGVVADEALAAELIEFVRGRIARYKCPRSLDFVDELPRTPTGKLLKRKVLETYLQPTS
ncbi:acyl-CoA synthetase [Nocardioides dubius]|uniref:Acyl-CoA synthetase n=1 Tax=Nocardioides dubius TaxID=317019 RepID=A0ABN1TZC9_9ACTN